MDPSLLLVAGLCALLLLIGFLVGRVSKKTQSAVPPLIQSERGFRGSLTDIPMASLINLVAGERKTGMLRVVAGLTVGHILCRNGQIISAHVEVHQISEGVEAVYDLVRLERGDFDFEPRPVGEGLGESIGDVTHLLMEAVRRIDEERERTTRRP